MNAAEVFPPQPPKLTDAMLAQNDFAQKQMAAATNVPISSKGLLRARAIIKDFERIPTNDLNPRQKKQLTEAYSQAGEFGKAFTLSGDDVYLAIATATAQICDCKDFETTEIRNGRPEKVTHSKRFKLRNILKDGKTVGLMSCSGCGHLSIK